MATLTRKELRALSVVSGADERTCTRFLAGLKVQPEKGSCIKRALAELGLDVTHTQALATGDPHG
jgi:hypothetical protein